MRTLLVIFSFILASPSYGSNDFFINDELVNAYTESAIQGDQLAQFALASFYGISCSTDCKLDKAIQWHKKAVEGGYSYSANDLGIIYKNIGDLDNAKYWYEKAASMGHTPALVNLGLLYFRDNKYHDYKTSFKYFSEAAEYEEYESLFHLGRAYKEGLGINKDLAQAFTWFKRSAEKGNSKAMRELGLMYQLGLHVEQNYDMAEKYLIQGAVLGNVESMHSLAVFYFGSPESHADVQKGLFYFQKAAMEGHELSKSKIGLIYGKGLGVPVNKDIEAILRDDELFN